MTVTSTRHVHGSFPKWAPAGSAALITVALGAALWVSTHIECDPVLQDVALFGHLASLVLGFGAVLAVDWVALLWVLRQRTMADILRAAENAHLPIWIGYAGLVVTGILLEPDLDGWATRAKLLLVLVIGWNGVVATCLQSPLAATSVVTPRALLMTSGASAALSQAGWWGAMVIGFLNGR